MLSDEERKVIRAFGIEDGENGIAWPAIYVISREGRVAWRSLSETYKEREAPAAILAALAKLSRSAPE